MKLAIGTAQFGLDYGVTNLHGAVDVEEVTKILDYACDNNILTIDTASAYGDSEKKLGNSGVDLATFKIITKIPSGTPPDELEARFSQSLNNLKLKKVHGLLIHNVNDILSDESNKIWKLLEKLKDQDLVGKIGVSVYSEWEIRQVLKKYEIDLIQLPMNIFDQRLLKNGILDEMKSKGIEIHARSLFLQGILLAKPDSLSEYFMPYKTQFIKWYNFLRSNNLTPLEGAIAFASSVNTVDCAVIGVTNLENLIEIKAAFDKVQSLLSIEYVQLATEDEALINPHKWKI